MLYCSQVENPCLWFSFSYSSKFEVEDMDLARATVESCEVGGH